MASAMESVELELCPNCKREIPQVNYVMHTMHCARNIALCPQCKESVPKSELEAHRAKHEKAAQQRPSATTSKGTQLGTAWKSTPYTGPFPEKLGRSSTVSSSSSTTTSSSISSSTVSSTRQGIAVNGCYKPTPPPRRTDELLVCKYCELELPGDTMKEHEDYCGTRTDKCNECGEFVMFKYKKLHEDSNHGFIKLNDEPGPRPSWDSSSQRTASSITSSSAMRRTNDFSRPFDLSSLATAAPRTGTSRTFNMNDYLPPSLTAVPDDEYRPSGGIRDQRKIDYKDLSRRLDCKTEYIRNLLHDSASITAPLRSGATQPRNHFNHQKGPAPQPPHRRPNPPTELIIPCEFCGTPIPHEELIEHETGCRPDLARFNPRRRRQEEEFYRYTPSPPLEVPASPEVELPCEFCATMIPASQLLRHQACCN